MEPRSNFNFFQVTLNSGQSAILCVLVIFVKQNLPSCHCCFSPSMLKLFIKNPNIVECILFIMKFRRLVAVTTKPWCLGLASSIFLLKFTQTHPASCLSAVTHDCLTWDIFSWSKTDTLPYDYWFQGSWDPLKWDLAWVSIKFLAPGIHKNRVPWALE